MKPWVFRHFREGSALALGWVHLINCMLSGNFFTCFGPFSISNNRLDQFFIFDLMANFFFYFFIFLACSNYSPFFFLSNHFPISLCVPIQSSSPRAFHLFRMLCCLLNPTLVNHLSHFGTISFASKLLVSPPQFACNHPHASSISYQIINCSPSFNRPHGLLGPYLLFVCQSILQAVDQVALLTLEISSLWLHDGAHNIYSFLPPNNQHLSLEEHFV